MQYLVTRNRFGKLEIRTLMGFNTLIRPSEVKSIIAELNQYCKDYTDDEVDVINENIKQHFFDTDTKNKKEYQQKQCSGYVYLLKCDEFYKIGYSKCVEQRIHQLDVRPYKITLLMKWHSDIAYNIEQALHEIYKQYRVDNEWYSSELPIDTLDKTIYELETTYEI